MAVVTIQALLIRMLVRRLVFAENQAMLCHGGRNSGSNVIFVIWVEKQLKEVPKVLNIIILGLTSFFTDVSSEMVYPLLPLFLTTTLGATPAIVGLVEGFAESLASLLKVFSGYFSDKTRMRKPLTLAGYSVSALGKAILLLANSWTVVLLSRSADRFGKGVRTAPRDALIADTAEAKRRGQAFGIHRTLDTLGAIVGVSLGYFFLTRHQGSYYPVFLYSIVPAVLGVAVLSFVKERPDGAPLKARKLSWQWSSLSSRLKLFLGIVFIFALGNSSNQFLLLHAKNIGFDVKTVILLYLVYNIVYSMVSYPAGSLSDRFGRRNFLIFGYPVYSLVYLLFGLVRVPQQMWYLFGLYGIYSGITEGVEKAFIADIAPPHLRATMIGLHATLTGIGLFPASLLAGLLWNRFGAPAPFFFGSAMGLLAAVGIAFIMQTESKKDADAAQV